MPTPPRHVADDQRLLVLLRLQLQQGRAAAGVVRRVGAVQHQAFAAGMQHLLQPRLQCGR